MKNSRAETDEEGRRRCVRCGQPSLRLDENIKAKLCSSCKEDTVRQGVERLREVHQGASSIRTAAMSRARRYGQMIGGLDGHEDVAEDDYGEESFP